MLYHVLQRNFNGFYIETKVKCSPGGKELVAKQGKMSQTLKQLLTRQTCTSIFV